MGKGGSSAGKLVRKGQGLLATNLVAMILLISQLKGSMVSFSYLTEDLSYVCGISAAAEGICVGLWAVRSRKTRQHKNTDALQKLRWASLAGLLLWLMAFWFIAGAMVLEALDATGALGQIETHTGMLSTLEDIGGPALMKKCSKAKPAGAGAAAAPGAAPRPAPRPRVAPTPAPTTAPAPRARPAPRPAPGPAPAKPAGRRRLAACKADSTAAEVAKQLVSMSPTALKGAKDCAAIKASGFCTNVLTKVPAEKLCCKSCAPPPPAPAPTPAVTKAVTKAESAALADCAKAEIKSQMFSDLLRTAIYVLVFLVLGMFNVSVYKSAGRLRSKWLDKYGCNPKDPAAMEMRTKSLEKKSAKKGGRSKKKKSSSR